MKPLFKSATWWPFYLVTIGLPYFHIKHDFFNLTTWIKLQSWDFLPRYIPFLSQVTHHDLSISINYCLLEAKHNALCYKPVVLFIPEKSSKDTKKHETTYEVKLKLSNRFCEKHPFYSLGDRNNITSLG